MDVKKFWNEAIKSYFVNDNEYVFISFSKEIVDNVADSYFKTLPRNIETENLREKLISNNGGNEKSYYKAIRSAMTLTRPTEYPYLKFSFFPFVAFQLQTRTGYWDKFQNVVNDNVGSNISRNKWIEVLNISIKILRHRSFENGYNFLDVNIFGQDTNFINVGRIYTHAVFQKSHLEEVKKAICSLNYHNLPVEDFNEDSIGDILEEANLRRARALLNDCPELIIQTIKTSLKNWKPTEKEVIEYTTKPKINQLAGGLPLRRIWNLEYNAIGTSFFHVKLGFAWRSHLGNEGKIFLDKDESIFIDLDHSPPKPESWDKYIYILSHDSIGQEIILENKKWGLKFKPFRHLLFKQLPFALISISGTYFYELNEKKVLFANEKVVHVSRNQIIEHGGLLTRLNDLEVSNHGEQLYFYLVRGEGEIEGISYVRVNYEIELGITGVGNGVPGVRSFLASFPISISKYNPAYGDLRVLDEAGNVIKEVNKDNSSLTDFVISIGRPGKYRVKVFNKGFYEKFKSGYDSIEFEVVKKGSLDRREDCLTLDESNFDFTKFNEYNRLNNIEQDWKILFKNDWNLKYLPHFLFDFIFSKERSQVHVDKTKFFLIAVPSLPGKLLNIYHFHPNGLERKYSFRSTNNEVYEFTAKAVFNAEIDVPVNQEWYNYELCPSKSVLLEVFKFNITGYCESLKEKYPGLHEDIFLLTNCITANNPELLMEIYCQESFPFKCKLSRYAPI